MFWITSCQKQENMVKSRRNRNCDSHFLKKICRVKSWIGGDDMLTFLGWGSGFASENTSAYLENENDLFLVDCGYIVFQKVREKLNLEKYRNIYILITHLHPDHAGSLGQLILYLNYVLAKKPTVVTRCEKMPVFLSSIGVNEES